MMFERELSGSLRQRGVHLLLATALIIPSPAIAQVSGYPVDPAEQGRTRTRQTDADSSSVARSGENAAATQIYVPRNYEPDELEGTPRVDATGRRILTEEEFLTDRNREYASRAPRRPAQPGEFETYVSKMVGKPLRRFGANLLIPDARDFTAPPTTTVPPDYRLNPGDELLIGLTGSVQGSDLRLTITP